MILKDIQIYEILKTIIVTFIGIEIIVLRDYLNNNKDYPIISYESQRLDTYNNYLNIFLTYMLIIIVLKHIDIDILNYIL